MMDRSQSQAKHNRTDSDDDDEDYVYGIDMPLFSDSDSGSDSDSDESGDFNSELSDEQYEKTGDAKVLSKSKRKMPSRKSTRGGNKKGNLPKAGRSAKASSPSQRRTNGNDRRTKKRQEKTAIESDDEEKSRAEDLWAGFLKETKPTPNTIKVNKNTGEPSQSREASTSTTTKISKTVPTTSKTSETKDKNKPQTRSVATETNDFSNNEINVDPPTDVKTTKLNSKAKVGVKRPASPADDGTSSSRGLCTLLNQIGKKKKLSVLEKTQLDWNSFKHDEGIEEELQTFNRGRDGYLERQDFLRRTDMRQFQIEKNLRHSRHSD